MTLKKLLVLDVNGLLIDTYFHKEPLPEGSPDARVGNFYVYRRPFCEEFLQFCLENFIVGIWSSAREYNVNNLVDYVFGDAKERLAFSWVYTSGMKTATQSTRLVASSQGDEANLLREARAASGLVKLLLNLYIGMQGAAVKESAGVRVQPKNNHTNQGAKEDKRKSKVVKIPSATTAAENQTAASGEHDASSSRLLETVASDPDEDAREEVWSFVRPVVSEDM
ncbi:hypothetical protein L7F22_040298 [Adiantum nelumboides]|nr:hypothetical protein [Adiantum nelumboides]